MNQTMKNLKNSLAVPYHRIRGFMAANHYDYPASGMTVIGVTGTNGKTSTCFMIHNILLEAGLKVGLMTTIGNSVDGKFEESPDHMTTSDARTLNKRLAEMRSAGVQYLVIEVSSHALAQGRVFGIPFDIVVMTNVASEHLDYHRTFQRYLQAKCRLFKLAAANAKQGGQGVGIINADDKSAKAFARLVPKPVTYGIKQGKLKATRIKRQNSGSSYEVKVDGETYHIKINIPGEFYIYNSLAAVAACHALGMSRQQIENGLKNLTGVEGRMNVIPTGLGFDVIIDFAHTPDAYQKLLPDVKANTKGKVIVISGAAGERDKTKFPTMGKIAGKYSDLIILTEEDARGPVRPQSELVAKGARQAGKTEGKDLLFIDDRAEAIETAIMKARKNDVVLLLGMGHEKAMARANGKYIPWNERQVAEQAIAKRQKKKAQA